jgi:formate hydrogenlyase subunit 3/multisubunit Na+/H+ antiporter MnhD subunit
VTLTPAVFLVMALGHVAGAGGALVTRSASGARRLATAGAIVGSSAGFVLSLDALIRGTTFQLEISQLLAVAGGVSFRLDPLGAFFLLVVEVVALPATIFGGAYSRVY